MSDFISRKRITQQLLTLALCIAGTFLISPAIHAQSTTAKKVEFKVGDRVKYEYNGKTEIGTITKVSSSSSLATVQFEGKKSSVLKPKKRLTLLPPKVFKPKKRTWLYADGKKSYTGTYLEHNEDSVTIETLTGDVVVLSREKLSKTDKKYVDEIPGAKPNATDKKFEEDFKDFRVWTGKKGEYKLKAKFVSVRKRKVSMQREDGLAVTIEYSKFCIYDRAVINSLDSGHRNFGKPVPEITKEQMALRKQFPKYVEVKFINSWDAGVVTQLQGPNKNPSGAKVARGRSSFSSSYAMQDVRIVGSRSSIQKDLLFEAVKVTKAGGLDDGFLELDANAGDRVALDRATLKRFEGKWTLPIDGLEKTELPSREGKRRKRINLTGVFGQNFTWTSTVLSKNNIGVVCYKEQKAPEDTFTSPTFIVADLTTGKEIQRFHSKASFLADISDDGKTLIAFETSHPFEEHISLYILKQRSGNFKTTEIWKITATDSFRDKKVQNIKLAKIVDSKHLLTQSSEGHVTLWDMDNRRAVWMAEGAEHSPPVLSPNKKLIAMGADSDRNKIVILDTLQGKVQAVISTKKSMRGKFAFSLNGEKLVFHGSKELAVFNLKTGKKDGSTEISIGRNESYPVWLDDKFVLISNKHVIHAEHFIHVWEYQQGDRMRRSQMDRPSMFTIKSDILFNTTSGRWLFHSNKHEKLCFFYPVQLVNNKILELTKNIKSEDKILAAPGTRIGIKMELSGSPAIQKQVKQSLIKMIQAAGLVYDPRGSYQLIAKTSVGKTVEKTFVPFGTSRFNRDPNVGEKVRITPHISSLNFVKDGKSLWRKSTSSPTSFIRLEKGETAAQAIQRRQKTNYRFFDTATLPKGLTKPLSRTPLGKSSY